MDTNQLTPEDNKMTELIDERLRQLGLLKEKCIKPPLGIIPRKFWLEERLTNLDAAIERYNEALKEVPQIWYDERTALLNELQPSPAKDEVEYYCMREQDGNDRCLNQCEYCKRFNTNQAQQQVEDVKERWKPKFADRYYTIDLVGTGIDIRQRMWADKTTDYNNSELGNFFKTEAEAEIVAQKIKNLLKN